MPESVWETGVYQAGRQINRWPFSELISRTFRSLGGSHPNETRVLELGCGTGNNLRFLAEEGFIPFGIDASPTAIEKARELLAAHELDATLQVGDITELPWPDNSFDLVLDRAALVHNTPARIRLVEESFPSGSRAWNTPTWPSANFRKVAHGHNSAKANSKAWELPASSMPRKPLTCSRNSIQSPSKCCPARHPMGKFSTRISQSRQKALNDD